MSTSGLSKHYKQPTQHTKTDNIINSNKYNFISP